MRSILAIKHTTLAFSAALATLIGSGLAAQAQPEAIVSRVAPQATKANVPALEVQQPILPQVEQSAPEMTVAAQQVNQQVARQVTGEGLPSNALEPEATSSATAVSVAATAPVAAPPTTPLAPGQEALPISPLSGSEPQPGSGISTSAADLNGVSAPTASTPSASEQPTQIAQTIEPGRATRSGSSYVGVGGNIGIVEGDTQIGDGSFAVFGKIGLLNYLSVRPVLLFSDDVSILLPITYDFSGEPLAETGVSFAPYVGIGPAFSTGDGSAVDLLLTGGIDIPVTRQFTVTAGLFATVTGDPSLGLLLGVGYNFRGF